MAGRVYLDWNATALIRPEARAAAMRALDAVGNPSSVHGEGRAARRLVEDARGKVAELVGVVPSQVIFTSGATEANALALTPGIETQAEKGRRDRLLVSAIEHPSVLAGGRFAPEAVERVPVGAAGLVDLAALERRLAALPEQGIRRPLVSIMLANNETGIVQPVAAAAAIAHAAGALLHVDAVQAAGRISCDFSALGADLLTISSHKMGGPKGAGALIVREGIHIGDPLVKGGGQERGLRGGTENVPGIAGFGAAAQAAARTWAEDGVRMMDLRERLEAGLRAISPAVTIFGSAEERLPNTTFFAVAGIKAETAVIGFDLEGIAVSSGAACSSGKVQPSHVLEAMGAPAALRGAVRVSLGWETSESDVEAFLRAWKKLSKSLGKAAKGMAA